MDSSPATQLDWTELWPAGAERIEVIDGRLAFELRGFSRTAWTQQDLAAAQRCYRGHAVHISESGAVLYIEPAASHAAGDGVELTTRPGS